jgi:uncharacterized protein
MKTLNKTKFERVNKTLYIRDTLSMTQLFITVCRRLAKQYVMIAKPYVIGIAWSVWKTSCRMIVAQLVQKVMPDAIIVTSPHNYNSELWVALAVMQIDSYTPTPRGASKTVMQMTLKLIIKYLSSLKILFGKSKHKQQTEVLFLEYWVDYAGEMAKELWIVRPDMAIYTATDKVHAMQFWNAEHVLTEDISLLLAAKEAIYIPQEEKTLLDDYIKEYKWDIFVYTCIPDNHTLDIWSALSRQIDNHYLKDWLPYIDTVSIVYGEKYTTTTQYTWYENYGYITLWYLLARILSKRMWEKTILADWSRYQWLIALQPWRWTLMRWYRDSLCIDSTYNASPKSMRAVIANICRLRDIYFPGSPVWYCLGDMRELGEYTEEEHVLLWEYITTILWTNDKIVLVGEVMKKVCKPLLEKSTWWVVHNNTPSALRWYASSRKAWIDIKQDLDGIDGLPPIIVAKWSQNTLYLEETLMSLLDPQTQQSLLPRQTKRRHKKKQAFFGSLMQTASVLFLSVFLSWCGIQNTNNTDNFTNNAIANTHNSIMATWASVCFQWICKTLEVAHTPQERAYGLMNRSWLAPDSGMIFVFPKPDIYKFWMKNTLIPLDILWLDEWRKVIFQSLATPPCETEPCQTYWPLEPSHYVIELPAWEVQKRWINEWMIVEVWVLPDAY